MDIKRTKRIIDYMESAQDNTSVYHEIDKLLLDDEMGHEYQHTMGEYNEPWQPMPEDALPMGAGVKLFRGVPKWFRGQMVKKGKYMSPTLKRRWSPWDVQEGVWATRSKQYAKDMAQTPNKKGMVLEFDVPTKWWEWASLPFRKDVIRRMQGKSTAMPNFYREGIPKKYLKKVHKGYQEGGPIDLESAVQDETAHSQMDRLMFENELEQQPQHSMRALDYGTNIFGQQITEPYNIEKAISEGDFLPPVGMAKMIGKSAKPFWKHATGESILESMEKAIKENIPEYYEKPRKWITGVRGSAKLKPDDVSFSKVENPEARKKLENIYKKYFADESKVSKPKPKTKTSEDFVKEARQVLDINIAEGLSQIRKHGSMSPVQENKISGSVKNLENAASKWLRKPDRKFKNIERKASEWFKPSMGKQPWPVIRQELDRMPPQDQMKILGPSNYRNYEIWNTLIGKTGNWGAARGNLKLKPDVLNPNIVPVNKRRPK